MGCIQGALERCLVFWLSADRAAIIRQQAAEKWEIATKTQRHQAAPISECINCGFVVLCVTVTCWR